MGDPSAEVRELGLGFWEWRRVQAPRSGDDIPRIERPGGWLPDWRPTTVAGHREQIAVFERTWRELDVSEASVDVQVDHRLIGSAIARVDWELDRVRTWRRDPSFYIDQSLGVFFDALLSPAPFTAQRGEHLVMIMDSIPAMLEAARSNLTETAAPFARVAIEKLREVTARVEASVAALGPHLDPDTHGRLTGSATTAAAALDEYRTWLESWLPEMGQTTAVGRDQFGYFLSRVALWPYTPKELTAMGRQEWNRAVAFERLEQNRNRGLPPLVLPERAEDQVETNRLDEEGVRRFYEEQGILTQPTSLRHYRNLVLPAYLQPLTWLGVTDDLTSPSRLDEDGISYVPTPSPDLPYFYLAFALDPRTGIAHEGVHYQQLALSYGHPNPLRRYYYDSGPNEGLAFYNEELMLQAGLFDDSPRSREIIYSFMRLRALRVEVDVQLAIDGYDLDQAADYLERAVPMDRETAWEEAAFFAATPGQGLTYQIGKLSILRMLADAVRARGDDFELRSFHDFLWRNGNVPLSLQRWEMLGDRGELDRVDELAELTHR